MTVPLSNDPDQALIEACQASRAHGLEGAFREMYELYRDRVYNVCYRVTGNGTDALDASQETFGILFRKIAGFASSHVSLAGSTALRSTPPLT